MQHLSPGLEAHAACTAGCLQPPMGGPSSPQTTSQGTETTSKELANTDEHTLSTLHMRAVAIWHSCLDWPLQMDYALCRLVQPSV